MLGSELWDLNASDDLSDPLQTAETMSLALLQSYSSADEDEDAPPHQLSEDEVSSADEQNGAVSSTTRSYKPLFDTNPASSSSLPSALDAFSEVNLHNFLLLNRLFLFLYFLSFLGIRDFSKFLLLFGWLGGNYLRL